MILSILLLLLGLSNALFICSLVFKVMIVESQISIKHKVVLNLLICLVILGFGFSDIVWGQYPVTALVLFATILALDVHTTDWRRLVFIISFILLLVSFISYTEGMMINEISRQFHGSNHFVIVLGVIFQIVNLVIITFLPQKFYSQLFRALDSNNFFVATSIILTISLVLFILYTVGSFDMSPRKVIALVMFGLFSILGLINYGMYCKQKKVHKERMNDLLNYTREIENLYDELSMFRHDYLNILMSLRIGIEKKDLVMIEQIFRDLIMPTEKFVNNQSYEIARINKIKIPEIKSILYMKLSSAKMDGIAVSIDIPKNIYAIAIEFVQFIRILSILMDNAIESARESRDKKINISIFEYDEVQVLMVGNTTKETEIDVNKIYEKNYSTKQSNENERGLGLYYLGSIVKKMDELYIETQFENHYFSQTIKMVKK